MVQGMKFLSKKSFNPTNLSNQKRVWEREQRAKQEEERLKQREIQLRRERDDQELAEARGDAARNSVSFLYKAPPGMTDEKKGTTTATSSSTAAAATNLSQSKDLVFERQPGDDDAAAAFRQLLAATSNSAQDTSTSDAASSHENPSSAAGSAFGVVLQGTTETSDGDEPDSKQPAKPSALSALEKAVGRKNNAAVLAGTTLEEQIQRFPALANAPREKGLDASKVGVNFKPLGAHIRNVRCFVCGTWGHSKGDRECPKSGWNPFASSSMGATSAAPSTNLDSQEIQQQRPVHDAKGDKGDSSRRPDDSRDRRRRRRRREYDDGYSSVSSYSSASYDSRDRKQKRRSHRDYDSDEEDRRRRRHKRSRRDDERRHKKKKSKSRKRYSRRDEERRERRPKDER